MSTPESRNDVGYPNTPNNYNTPYPGYLQDPLMLKAESITIADFALAKDYLDARDLSDTDKVEIIKTLFKELHTHLTVEQTTRTAEKRPAWSIFSAQFKTGEQGYIVIEGESEAMRQRFFDVNNRPLVNMGIDLDNPNLVLKIYTGNSSNNITLFQYSVDFKSNATQQYPDHLAHVIFLLRAAIRYVDNRLPAIITSARKSDPRK